MDLWFLRPVNKQWNNWGKQLHQLIYLEHNTNNYLSCSMLRGQAHNPLDNLRDLDIPPCPQDLCQSFGSGGCFPIGNGKERRSSEKYKYKYKIQKEEAAWWRVAWPSQLRPGSVKAWAGRAVRKAKHSKPWRQHETPTTNLFLVNTGSPTIVTKWASLISCQNPDLTPPQATAGLRSGDRCSGRRWSPTTTATEDYSATARVSPACNPHPPNVGQTIAWLWPKVSSEINDTLNISADAESNRTTFFSQILIDKIMSQLLIYEFPKYIFDTIHYNVLPPPLKAYPKQHLTISSTDLWTWPT